MRPDDVLKLLKMEPFQPFRICMTDGSVHDIRHPELCMVGRTHLFVGRPAPGETKPIYDDCVYLALLHINRMEPIPVAPKVGSN